MERELRPRGRPGATEKFEDAAPGVFEVEALAAEGLAPIAPPAPFSPPFQTSEEALRPAAASPVPPPSSPTSRSRTSCTRRPRSSSRTVGPPSSLASPSSEVAAAAGEHLRARSSGGRRGRPDRRSPSAPRCPRSRPPAGRSHRLPLPAPSEGARGSSTRCRRTARGLRISRRRCSRSWVPTPGTPETLSNEARGAGHHSRLPSLVQARWAHRRSGRLVVLVEELAERVVGGHLLALVELAQVHALAAVEAIARSSTSRAAAAARAASTRRRGGRPGGTIRDARSGPRALG